MKRTLWVVAAFPAFLAVLSCNGASNPTPASTPTPSPVVVTSPSPVPSPTPVPVPSPSPTATPDPTPTPTPQPTPHPTPPPPTPIPDLIINIVGMSFSPSSASAQVGQRVIWRNTDSTSHTATANNGAFNSGIIAPGAQFGITVTSAGNFPYSCQIHPGMNGSLSVSN